MSEGILWHWLWTLLITIGSVRTYLEKWNRLVFSDLFWWMQHLWNKFLKFSQYFEIIRKSPRHYIYLTVNWRLKAYKCKYMKNSLGLRWKANIIIIKRVGVFEWTSTIHCFEAWNGKPFLVLHSIHCRPNIKTQS